MKLDSLMADIGVGWEGFRDDRRVTAGNWGTSGSTIGGIFSLLAFVVSSGSFSANLVRCRLLGVVAGDGVTDTEEQLDATVELELLRVRFPSTVCIFGGILEMLH